MAFGVCAALAVFAAAGQSGLPADTPKRQFFGLLSGWIEAGPVAMLGRTGAILFFLAIGTLLAATIQRRAGRGTGTAVPSTDAQNDSSLHSDLFAERLARLQHRTLPGAAGAAIAAYGSAGLAEPQTGAAAHRAGTSELQLTEARKTCLAIRHVFPPRHPQRSLSYLGGYPVAPQGFVWPRAQGREGFVLPLSFAAQIDCAGIPAGELRDLLPERGVLYFFFPNGDGADAAAVRYVGGSPGLDWQPAPDPDLPPVGGLDSARYRFPWMNWRADADSLYPRAHPKIEIELGWVDQGELDPDDGDLPEADIAAYRQNLVGFHGRPVEHDPLLSHYGKPSEGWRVHEGFPLSWQAVEIFGGYLLTILAEQRKLLAAWHAAQGASPAANHAPPELPDSPEALLDLHARIEAQAADLMGRSTAALDEPSPADKAEFWDLVDSLSAGGRFPVIARWKNSRERLPLNNWLSEAAILSADACLADRAAAGRVPQPVVDALRWHHAVLRNPEFESRGGHYQHQLLGRGRVIQDAAAVMAETHLLLLQLGPDEAAAWEMGDCGAYQYWITPADLAARRFERVTVTFECH